MNDFLRESFSYFGLYRKLLRAKKTIDPAHVSFGADKDQYFLYYEPQTPKRAPVVVWVHGGGWNAGSPKYFDFVGQRMAKEGYRFVSLGYRLSPKNKYPCQIEDVCRGYRAAMAFLAQNGIDASRVLLSGPSAGAHLASLLCYSQAVQEQYGVDVSNVAGFIGVGGPYRFAETDSAAVKALLNQLFAKGYDRRQAEPLSLMTESAVPMLLIQSRHDGLIDYACAEAFCEKAKRLGNDCELYCVADKKDTHSWYTAGLFLESREENQALDKFLSYIEAMH